MEDSWEDIDEDSLNVNAPVANNTAGVKDSWDDEDADEQPTAAPTPAQPTQSLEESVVEHVALLVRLENVQEVLHHLAPKLADEKRVIEEEEKERFELHLARRERTAKEKNMTAGMIKNDKEGIWIPKAAKNRDQNVAKRTEVIRKVFEKNEAELTAKVEDTKAKLAKVETITAPEAARVKHIHNLYTEKFAKKNRFVPPSARLNGISDLKNVLVSEKFMPNTHTRENLVKKGALTANTHSHVFNAEGITPEEYEVLKTVADKLSSGGYGWMDQVFEETYHWHSGKALDEYQDWDEDDENSRNNDFMWHYGQSLEISQKPPELNEFSQQLRVRVEIQPEQFPKNTKATTKWNVEVGKIEDQISNLRNRSRHNFVTEARKMVLQFVSNSGAPDNNARNTACTFILAQILKYQMEQIKDVKDAKNLVDEKVQLYTTVRDLEVNFPQFINENTKLQIAKAKQVLGGCSVRFQMNECSPFLLKNSQPQFYSHPDIPFIPDLWQKELITHIDHDKSCLVVAPTSAGKSFVSFYTISRVLERSKKTPIKVSAGSMKSRVVFVAPTLPLCNQMAATVLHRYNHNVPVGIFTSEFRTNVENCQVLVCTPNILEILLMSPSCESWRKNLLYAILDEIHYARFNRHKSGLPHSNNNNNKTATTTTTTTTATTTATAPEPTMPEGDDTLSPTLANESSNRASSDPDIVDTTITDAYSRIFALLECPFLALSATIANPDQTRAWLQGIREGGTADTSSNVNTEVVLVPSKHAVLRRWVDLQSYYYTPPETEATSHAKEVFGNTERNGLHPLHPIALVHIANVAGMPADIEAITLSAPEMLRLYDVMQKVTGDKLNTKLDPEKSFANIPYIDRNATAAYQKSLLAEFSKLKKEQQLAVSKELFGAAPVKDNNQRSLHLVDFINQLRSHNMLPALCFCEDAALIEWSLEVIVQQLEKMEALHGKKPEYGSLKTQQTDKKDKDSSAEVPESEETESNVNIFDLRRKMARAAMEDKLKVIKAEVWPVDFNYSLRKRTDELEGVMQYWLERLILKLKIKSKHIWVRGLARGIAIYHSGLPKPYRDLVETMFRAGLIQFVISTRTLSVGVNMPCKAVAFLVDSRFMDSVDFRQMSGRAGRRGFDFSGSTVFCMLPFPRIAQLTLSPMQSLIGASALDVNSILRALILYRQAKDKDLVKRGVERWMIAPASKSGPAVDSPASVLLFAMELLYRLNLIDKQAKPIGVSGLVAHNFGVFPANFAFAYLVLVGAFDEICAPFAPSSLSTPATPNTKNRRNYNPEAEKERELAQEREREKAKEKSLQQLLLIVSFLLNRIPIRSDKCRVLPSVPEDIVQNLREFNLLCSNCAVDCKNSLPNSDDLPVPAVDLETPPSSLNSYAYDFFQHKDIFLLTQNNELSDNGAYNLLKQFNSALRKFATAITKGVTDSKTNAFAIAMNSLADKYNKAFNGIEY